MFKKETEWAYKVFAQCLQAVVLNVVDSFCGYLVVLPVIAHRKRSPAKKTSDFLSVKNASSEGE